ncbi:endonuclease domain-containing protein [Marinomonas sp. GJ51-6]|uniref:endonuclease domain-containing protein n=1 Tax=Marinomonas sp. GJ51-6 TaxID=2992802 RepID=UPI002935254C|nr:endonuclease domain-containing protein [Marinomonas sp. GJ51-6]WOD06231.1 endonuclease domain-containing protein [Marinomonas sp. GJ51-6]
MTKIFNIKGNAGFRVALRKNMTEPERRLWSKIRNRQLGVKFRRQFGIGQYVVDFYCPEKRLVVEVDGDSHFNDSSATYDLARDAYFNSLNIQVLRFTNLDVMQNLDGVLLVIMESI